MMFGHDFYHGTIRRYIIMFGNIFNEIQVNRFNSSGVKIQSINVPISYGPKQRFIERVLADPTLNRSTSITLPRLSFSMNSMSYNPSRKLNSGHRFTKGVNTGGTDFASMYAPVPYDFSFSLSLFTKNAEDGIQIIEQIVPFFTPDFTLTMKSLPELNLNLDIPIELLSVTSDDSYEGSFEDQRVLTWDLDFVVKGYLFGPVSKNKYINKVTISYFDGFDATTPDAIQTFTGNSNFEISSSISSPYTSTPVTNYNVDSLSITADSSTITTDKQ